jgi:hypothetical protein
MPNEVRAYACSHGCRRSVLTNKARMAAHEKNCFSNPAIRACKTCIHFCFEDLQGEGYRNAEIQVRFCDIDFIPPGKFAVRDCPGHVALSTADKRGRVVAG